MKKMRYMEKNMRNGRAWSGSEVNAQFSEIYSQQHDSPVI